MGPILDLSRECGSDMGMLIHKQFLGLIWDPWRVYGSHMGKLVHKNWWDPYGTLMNLAVTGWCSVQGWHTTELQKHGNIDAKTAQPFSQATWHYGKWARSDPGATPNTSPIHKLTSGHERCASRSTRANATRNEPGTDPTTNFRFNSTQRLNMLNMLKI